MTDRERSTPVGRELLKQIAGHLDEAVQAYLQDDPVMPHIDAARDLIDQALDEIE